MSALKKYNFIVFFGLLIISKKASAQGGIDLRILEAVNPRYPTSQYWKYTSTSAYVFSGVATVAPFLYGLASGDDDAQHKSYNILIAMGLDIVAQEGLKLSFNRERPGDKYPDLVFPSSSAHGKSFPSGHTSLAFNTAAELTIQYKKWYIAVPAYLWAGSVGYSRLYLGKHYTSDVLGGAATGIGTAYLSTWLNRKLFKSHDKHG
jgi:membrane-associated phospholipid phosphatase